MHEAAILFAQLVATGLIAMWLGIGLVDNIRHPGTNETYTAEVLSLARMKQEFPEVYARMAHRAIHDRKRQRQIFTAVIYVEALALGVLTLGVIALAAASLGFANAEVAKPLALFGATVFSAIWGGFLVVGNYFGYWLCHDGAQNTHYQMTLWGLGTMILLTQ